MSILSEALKTRAEIDKNKLKRVAASDPVALNNMGARHYLEGDYGTAFEYLTKAAELDNAEAHYQLSRFYREGVVGVEKDERKRLYHLEEAAIGGHAKARFQLACYEWIHGRFDREVKHLIIAANLGYDNSLKLLRTFHAEGIVSKEDLASALRGHQAAVDATKSPQREAAEVYRNGSLLKGEGAWLRVNK